MINQPEERPLSIGAAVQFTHKGKTIHGHLLQRQGRRRFAKVVDTARADLERPRVNVKALGRSATSHDHHAARQRTR